MKINITEHLQRERVNNQSANIAYFLINLLTYTEALKGSIKPNSVVDVTVKINEVEVDFLKFVESLFDQFNDMVKKAAQTEIDSITQEFHHKFDGLLAQFMHKNGLISEKEYSEKVYGY